MRSNTIRLFILVASVLITVIMGVQVYWLNKNYRFEKNEFNNSVIKSIRGVYEDMPLLNDPSEKLQSLIEKKEADRYIFRIDSIPEKDSLALVLHNELESFNIFTDCKIATFDPAARRWAYTAYLPSAASAHTADSASEFPLFIKEYPYVQLYFPHRNTFIIHQLTGWIFSSALLLILLLAFAGSLYYFFQQKFLVEVQKDFINNITHEFSTPLSVIEISLDGLQQPTVLNQPDRYRKYVHAIQYQTEYLKKHIDNLIRSVITDRHKFPSQPAKLNPNKLLQKAANQLEPLLNKKNGEIKWQLDEQDTTLLAEEETLYLAFFNILNNAIKYSAQPVILIQSTWQPEKFTVRIKDNGTGIEPHELKNIFKKFYRVQQGNIHTVKGLGLGLYFTKKVIDSHHGKIDVLSIPGIGSEFKIELPINKALWK